MKPYKLHIVYHGIKSLKFEEVLLEFWQKKINLPIEITRTFVSETEEQVRLKFFQYYSSGKEAWGTANGKQITRKYVEQSSYHQVIFLYDATEADLWDQMTGNKFLTSWSFWEELYSNTEYTEVRVANTALVKRHITHETMHALAKKCQRSGRSSVVDHMDWTMVNGVKVEYYKDDDYNAPDGNYERTLKSITENNAWETISLDTRNMYESRKVNGESTIVLKKDGKWFDVATTPALWPYVQAKYQIPNNPPPISRAEVEANKGGVAQIDIYFSS